MPITDYLLRSFLQTDAPTRLSVLEAVKAAGFTVERIEEDFRTPEKWGLVLKASRSVSDLFRLDREVLLWCTNYPAFQARDIEDIRSTMEGLGVRLTRSFVILVSRYDPTTRSSIEAESTLGTTIVHVSLNDLQSPTLGSGEATLTRLLLSKLYTRDLYDLPGATTRAADFFGRRKTVDAIADELITGQAQIGIFGLRKIGKTSLLNRLLESIAQSGRCLIGKVDLQWTTSVDPSPEYTLWALGEALYASSRIVRNIRYLRLFGQFAVASDAVNAGSVWEMFAHDLTALTGGTSRRVVIAFDEIERLIELGSSGGFIRLGRLFRGFDQQHPGRLRILISGTSPECAEEAQIHGQDNPLYRYLSIRYLSPLDAGDAEQLLKQLGQPIGLEWSSEALSYAVEQTGGHPALLRTLGSHVHTRTTPRASSVTVTRAVAVDSATDILTSDTAVLAQVTASLRDQYQDEFVMLGMLATGQVYSFRQLAASYPNELSHLIGYGLLREGIASERLAIALLESYIQQQTTGPGRASAVNPQALQIDESVDSLRVVASIQSGGFADVYLAVNETGEKFAIKAFRAARLSALEREVEHLQGLNHPGIVKFIEATQSAGGTPCLVMEYLDGPTLATYCNPTSALSLKDIVSVASDLLGALEYMHPDSREAQTLASGNELSVDDFQEWSRLRYGVVHRDIKPENVILEPTRAVLIDFNIAVRAADAVVTMSSTPGYLPPTFNGLAWTPTVDLYQLGVTLAQCGAAAKFTGENLEDLLSLAESRHGADLRHVLELLCGQSGDVTASSALAVFRRLDA